MTIKSLKNLFSEKLFGLYASEEVESFFFILIEAYLGLSKVDSVLKKDEIISDKNGKLFQQAIVRLQNHEPIQYIIGNTQFYALPFKVTPATLIPRPETEELVDWIIKETQNKNPSPNSILDIGTGAGCIAVSLAKNLPDVKVTAMDVSEDALKVASENAINNKVSVSFLLEDILNTQHLSQKYDLIVSNPPYVRNSEKKMMQKNVLDFEPEQALFVEDENPLLFYNKIAVLAKSYLNPNGQLFLEINEYLSKEVTQLLKKENFYSIELRKDFFGKDRMIKCTLGE